MALPTGPAVTFLFTDIEGSTRLERAVGSEAWAGIVAEHDRRLRGAIEGAGGHVVKTEGDAVFAAFASPRAAVEASVGGQRALAAEPLVPGDALRVRAGLHLGVGRVRSDISQGGARRLGDRPEQLRRGVLQYHRGARRRLLVGANRHWQLGAVVTG